MKRLTVTLVALSSLVLPGCVESNGISNGDGPSAQEAWEMSTDADENGPTRIDNYEEGNGYPVQCEDGQWSQSGGIQGACSGHGGTIDY